MNKTLLNSYIELCKPRIIALMLLTSTVGSLLAAPFISGSPWKAIIYGNIGIGLCASAAAAINHIIDQKIDSQMSRTKARPIASGKVNTANALTFAAVLTIIGTLVLVYFVNYKTAVLTLASLLGYAVVYTVFLKRATTQNIVIGGIAGAMPPLLGWVAVTDSIDAQGWLLVIIIFLWTPPHFWALAIAKKEEYQKVGIPMFSVIYGVNLTSLHAFLYTILMVISTIMPWLIGMSGGVYLALSIPLNLRFLYLSWRLWKTPENRSLAMHTFWYSIYYLLLLFLALLVDTYLDILLKYI